jgi:hypothetical protein
LQLDDPRPLVDLAQLRGDRSQQRAARRAHDLAVERAIVQEGPGRPGDDDS